MIVFDKLKIRELLTTENIFDLLEEFGGEPVRESFGLVSSTICHNPPGEGSRKLYYYENTGLFKCYTGCDEFFDPFQLVIKVADIQWSKVIDLNDAVRWIAQKFGFAGEYSDDLGLNELASDYERFNEADRIENISIKDNSVVLKEYDSTILKHLNYKVKLTPWLKEGISQEVLDKNQIGYYPGGEQITIPHFDIDNRFIGLRGRALCKEEAELYGKYRPVKAGGELYNHPLGMNLYNLNNSKENIKNSKTAIIFEGEKSPLLYQTYFGIENDMSVACCGSSVSRVQMELLLNTLKVNTIIVAFDRQFEKIGDKEYQLLMKKFKSIEKNYGESANIFFVIDRKMITGYKASPIDEGREKFNFLINNCLESFKGKI